MLGCYNGFFIAESVTVLSCVLLQFYFTLNKAGQFQWPRTESEDRSITEQQFRWLMEGLTTHPQKQVKRLKKAPDYTL